MAKTIKAFEQREKEFKEFMLKLLSAQTFDNFSTDNIAFSSETLQKTLNKFCDIIADHIKCDSCTINLQLYDYNLMEKAMLDLFIAEHFKENNKLYNDVLKISENVGSSESFIEKCKKHPHYKYLINRLTFPYWKYPKGVALLYASSEYDPWSIILKSRDGYMKYLPIESGITKEIYQENVARVRDRLTMRHTRKFRKLGRADFLVWNNLSYSNIFKSYYGAPIRIHSDGEVIGLLKVENKNLEGIRKETIIELMKISDANTLQTEMLQIIFGKKTDFKKKLSLKEITDKFDVINVSLLSLCYLLKDFKEAEPKDLDSFLFIPFPNQIEESLIHFFKNILDFEKIYRDKNEIEEYKKSKKYEMEIISEEDKFKNFKIWKINELLTQLYNNDKDFEKMFEENKIFHISDKNNIKSLFESLIFSIFKKSEAQIKFKALYLDNSKKDSVNFKNLLKSFVNSYKEANSMTSHFITVINNQLKDLLNKGYSSLIFNQGHNPIQIFFLSLDDEKELWKILLSKNNKVSINEFFGKIKNFYADMASLINTNKNQMPKKHDQSVPITPGSTYLKNIVSKVVISLAQNAPDFHFQIEATLKSSQNKSINIYFCILPIDYTELGNLINIDDNKEQAELYTSQFKILDIIGTKPTLQELLKKRHVNFTSNRELYSIEYSGEFLKYTNKDNRKSYQVVDLIHDRIAARTHEFANAFPVEQFDDNDSYKLTWAAYEIGKLIERHIVYRANKTDDPMPLTALEFSGIPISDLSFVDNLRNRYKSSLMIGDNIDVYLKDICFQLGMEKDVEYSSRIKTYTSYFKRLRERHEAYLRGNIALWLYLLSYNVFGIQRITNKMKKDIKEMKKSLQETVNKQQIMEIQKEIVIKEKEITSREKFIKNLKYFSEKIDNILEKVLNKGGEEFKVSTKKEYTKYLGDLKFDSPPMFEDEDQILDDAIKAILNNIQTERLIPCDDIIKIEKKLMKTSTENISHKDFEKILFRNYSYYARDSISLLFQLLNRKHDKEKKFKEFYRTCYDLRKILCTPNSEIEESIDFRPLIKLFALKDNEDNGEKNLWKEMFSFLKTMSTGDVFGEANGNTKYLKLNSRSIYKRIRTLITISTKQRPSALLDWELNRFDLYGTQMNCLYKNQVFSLYEYIWNAGDPFFQFDLNLGINNTNKDKYLEDYSIDHKYFHSEPETENKDKEDYPEKGIESNKYRKRWLCLRTNVQTGGYISMHISTLVDPEFVRAGYWEDNERYNLRKVQFAFGKLLHKYDRQYARYYECFSMRRNLISRQYVDWYKDYQNVLKQSPSENKDSKWFGSFLFEGIIDFLMVVLYTFIDVERHKENHIFHNSRFGLLNETITSIKTIFMDNKADLMNLLISLFNICVYSRFYIEDELNRKIFDKKIISDTKFNCQYKYYLKNEDYRKKQEQYLLYFIAGSNDEDLLKTFAKICKNDKKTIDKIKGLHEVLKEKIGILDQPDEIKKMMDCGGNEEIKGIWEEIKNYDFNLFSCNAACFKRNDPNTTDTNECVWQRCTIEENSACRFYQKAINLMEKVIFKIKKEADIKEADIKIMNSLIENLKMEMDFFQKLNSNDLHYQRPLFFIDAFSVESSDFHTLVNLKSVILRLDALNENDKIDNVTSHYWFYLYKILRHIRREQNSYLFKEGKKKKKEKEEKSMKTEVPDLWMRNKDETFARIKNYALLFRSEDIKSKNNECKNEFENWSAHDLYFYLRSLIPVEVQIRTKMVDTFAEQYHDSVYKNTPPYGTELPRANMIDVGKEIDKNDRELEIDYEDYALRYQLEKEKKDRDIGDD